MPDALGRTILRFTMDANLDIDAYETAVAALHPDGPDTHLFLPVNAGTNGRAILLLDASFNPPTVAHWTMVERGCAALHTSGAALVLSSSNVDKQVFGATLGQRIAMMVALASTRPDTTVAACCYARFVDKATALARLFPSRKLVFAIGYDTLIRLFDERYYDRMDHDLERLFATATVIVANRDTGDLDQIDRFLDHPSRQPYRDSIQRLSLPPAMSSISSSEIRARVPGGQTLSGLVPPPVDDFIQRHGLYSETPQ